MVKLNKQLHFQDSFRRLEQISTITGTSTTVSRSSAGNMGLRTARTGQPAKGRRSAKP